MPKMLELYGRKFKITMINMLKDLMGKKRKTCVIRWGTPAERWKL